MPWSLFGPAKFADSVETPVETVKVCTHPLGNPSISISVCLAGAGRGPAPVSGDYDAWRYSTVSVSVPPVHFAPMGGMLASVAATAPGNPPCHALPTECRFVIQMSVSHVYW